MKLAQFQIAIKLDGTAVFIHDDDAVELMSVLGPIKTTRASNVDIGLDGKWYATMIDGAILGPFDRRDIALAKEVEYLKAKLFNSNKEGDIP